jgi:manganese/zinc/iron transport system permease protein
VLYGELSYISRGLNEFAPRPVIIMGAVGLAVVTLIVVFYKELLVSSFDAMLAASLGFAPRLIHLALMAVLSIVIVSAFESVGAILVIAMLILPGATSQLLSTRLPVCLWLSVGHAAVSAVLGLHLGLWLNCSIAGAVVVAGTALFGLAWVFGPDGLLVRWRHTNASEPVHP